MDSANKYWHTAMLINKVSGQSWKHTSVTGKTKIIASLVHTLCPEVKLKFEDVELQNDQNSCGLFAIAFATSFCLGINPSSVVYDQTKLRSHLKQCLLDKNMFAFPTICARKASAGRLASFRVHCSCRMPLDYDYVFSISQCLLCSTSYH